jgi:Tol biopolymer transport system component
VVAYPAFSPDSRHFAYAARRNGKEFIMLDGLSEPKHDHCAGPAFSPDSKHLAYAVLDHQGGAIIVDGVRSDQTYETILDSGRVQFDNAGHLWAIGYRGHKFLRLCIDCGGGGN